MVMGLSVATVAMFSQVVSRYVFNNSLVWTEEISRYFIVLMAFMGISYGIKNTAHLRMDIIENLAPIMKKPLEIVSDAFFTAFCIYMIGPSFETVQSVYTGGSMSPAMGIPFYIVYMPLLIAFALGLLRMFQKYLLLVIRIIRKLSAKKKGEVAE